MKTFNILDRHLPIAQSYLVEASAGTGKTFAIEHLVIRLLLEIPDLSIDQILVVTFTQAATKELKQRIQQTLMKSLQVIEAREKGEELPLEGIPDYLLGRMEDPHTPLSQLRHQLKRALLHFEEASITTIHGFCHRMLSENAFTAATGDSMVIEDLLSSREMVQVIQNFFRTHLRHPEYSPGQLEIVLRENQRDLKKLESVLCKCVMRGEKIQHGTRSFGELFEEWVAVMKEMKNALHMNEEALFTAFCALAPHYYDLCDRQKQIKPENLEEIQRFCRLFNKTAWSFEDFDALLRHPSPLLKKFDPSNRKPKASPEKEIPSQTQQIALLQKKMVPLLEEGSHYGSLLGRMVSDCQKLLKHYLFQEEKFLYDDLLKEMGKAIKNPLFLHRLREAFRAVVIDEFQDTDPLQWFLFEKVFLSSDSSSVPVYLVGDPKQSIYGFRKADIYTYMKAAENMGAAACASLETNWRSQPLLVQGLNALFSTERLPLGFLLPKLRSGLPYHPVRPGVTKGGPSLEDGKGGVHFCIAKAKRGRGKKWPSEEMETTYFFPYIIEEMLRLQQEKGIPFREWAVLVRDRFQADRFSAYCLQRGIPTWNQRREPLKDSQAVFIFREWILAAVHYRDLSAIKKALAGPLLPSSIPTLLSLEDPEILNRVYIHMHHLREKLFDEGFASFFHALMQMKWLGSSQTVEERLLGEKEGQDLYREMLQLTDLIAEHPERLQGSYHQVLRFLDEMEEGGIEEEKSLVKKDPAQEGVRVLTLHMSKGLEFGMVFPLGLASRTPLEDLYVADESLEGSSLRPVKEGSDPHLAALIEEGDAEKLRQFYVAATRAKWRVYLPVALAEDLPHSVEKGTASPMELYLASSKGTMESMYAAIENEEGEELCRWIGQLPVDQGISQENLSPKSLFSQAERNEEFPHVSLLPPATPPQILEEKRRVFSFSSLTASLPSLQNNEHSSSRFSIEEKREKSVHTLPPGAETGVLLHRILEKIPFEAALSGEGEKEWRSRMTPFLKGSSLEEWEDVVSQLVLNALRSPLFEEDPSFSLAQLRPQEMYREMEFLFPFDSWPFQQEGFPSSSGFLKGVIDLIFLKGDRFYLLDWKTNWLGPSEEDYLPYRLEETMEEHRYDWQQKIYCEALKRYGRIMNSHGSPYSFGGVFYIFLRGLHPHQHSQKGIYFIHG